MLTKGAALFEKYKALKAEAGSHSPSLSSLKGEIPELKIKVDACFLSNPYATELFLKYFGEELVQSGRINKLLEFYPAQNNEIAKSVANHLNIDPRKIFIGNGATEIIQAIIHNFVHGKIVVNIPTFSPYYEFVRSDSDVVFFQLEKVNDFRLEPDLYIEFVNKHRPNTIVIINPNNPDGGYVALRDLSRIIHELSWVSNIIIDESFIHFAFEESTLKLPTIVPHILNMPNLYTIKSMSKDFGIAGVRCAYAIMSEERVTHLLRKGFLWNSNGLAEYFFNLYTRQDFLAEYEVVRKKYINESQFFLRQLNKIPQIRTFPTKANFVLVEIPDDVPSLELTGRLLVDHGIYVRDCSDKIGLNGKFVRIASRNKEENELIINAFSEIFSSNK